MNITKAGLDRNDESNILHSTDLRLLSELDINALFFPCPDLQVREESIGNMLGDIVGELEQPQQDINTYASARLDTDDTVDDNSFDKNLIYDADRRASSVNRNSSDKNLDKALEKNICQSEKKFPGELSKDGERHLGYSFKRSDMHSGNSKSASVAKESVSDAEVFFRQYAPVSLDGANIDLPSTQGEQQDGVSDGFNIIDDIFFQMQAEEKAQSGALGKDTKPEDTNDDQSFRAQTIARLKSRKSEERTGNRSSLLNSQEQNLHKKRARQDNSLPEPDDNVQKRRALKRSRVGEIESLPTPGEPKPSTDQRRLIRAQRNRESAERSRQRKKLEAEALERSVQENRTSNRLLVQSIEKIYSKLCAAEEAVGGGSEGEEKRKMAPDLFNSIAIVKNAMDSCPWTFRSHGP